MYHIGEELDSVLTFQALVGQRRHGHFDHDSHGMTGTSSGRPRPSSTVDDDAAMVPKRSAGARIKVSQDEKTGAYLLG